ncbi:S41 family peptidase [candidate division KSB1 bacterium]
MRKVLILSLLFIAAFAGAVFAQDEARLLRFPAINGDQIVFTYAGDLYTVSANGGTARRITSDDGYEVFARFSPDGKSIAFTGQYDGNTEVYLIPSEGGVPERITYTPTLGRDNVADRMGPNNIVMGWKNADEIIFRSRMVEPNSFNGQIYTVSKDGGLPVQLPFPRGGFNSFSPDGSKIAFNRIFREFRTWKRYRGGMADDIWVFDFNTKQTENITNNDAQNIIPMWSGNKIYFLSDRDNNERMNLYVYDTDTKQTKRLTTYSDFDMKFPALGRNYIVYEYGGFIYKFDLASERAQKVSIRINDDFLSGRSSIIDVSRTTTNFEISPDGKRALLGSHGEIFTVPAEHGNTRNLTNTSGVHERDSKWSPDGRWIAYNSDESGENELYIMQSDGKGETIKLTSGADTYYYGFQWSPDSKKLVWSDKMLRLRYVDIDEKRIKEVDKSEAGEFFGFSWSPDSKWLAYARPEEEVQNKIYVYNLEENNKYEVTDGWFNSGSPVFDPEGKYLYFTSARNFGPTYGQTEFNHIYQDMTGIYFVTLRKDVESPFKPKSDEVVFEKDEEEKEEPAEEKEEPAEEKAEEEKGFTIDTDGINSRIAAIPVRRSNYFNLQAVNGKIYYLRRGATDTQVHLFSYNLNSSSETDHGSVNGFEISADKKKMLIAQRGRFAIINTPGGPVGSPTFLDVSNMEMTLDRHEEWMQIYNEVWRHFRDFFYAPNMHGVDWEDVRDKYDDLLPYVNTREDLSYVLGEVVGELNNSHCYINGGALARPQRIQLGLLGAQFEKDRSGYFKITKILKGQNWTNNVRSPLTEIGVNAQEGDYIIAVNGKPTNEMVNIYESLVNTVGKQVTLTLNSAADMNGSRDVVVRPIANEQPLYYYNMVQTNIKKVEEATNGQVGYVHIPDMGPNGLNEFVKHFYPQTRKKALIVDVRGNGGGNVSPQIIERLRRESVMINVARNTYATVNPGPMIYGPMVCLLDQFSASDGDIFPYRFKKHEMGQLIGMRSWGGVVGYRGSPPQVDGGSLALPEFARYDLEGRQWVMEGYGVDPDIVLDNDPYKEYMGEDEQLNKAIEVIMEELRNNPRLIPPIPRYPIKR